MTHDPCGHCTGTGKILHRYTGWQICDACLGSGQVRTASLKSLPEIPDGMLLTASRRRLLRDIDVGVTCECCGQRAQRYRRLLSSSIVRALVFAYREHRLESFELEALLRAMVLHHPDLPRVGDTSMLRHWDLIELTATTRHYRVTAKGRRFILGQIRVPRYAFVYNNARHGLSDESVDVTDALGDKFNLDELLNPTGEQYDHRPPVGPTEGGTPCTN